VDERKFRSVRNHFRARGADPFDGAVADVPPAKEAKTAVEASLAKRDEKRLDLVEVVILDGP
jgi:hypothetical protein